MLSMPTTRLVSLDVFRGITIAGMVLVNNPGTWEHIYWPLEHAKWHGWTPTDLVFPFFVFIIGVAIPLAFARRIESGGSKRDLYLKIIRRTLIIFAIGLFLNGLPSFGLAEYRIPGVLQRLAVCYFFASIIFLNTKVRTQIAIAIGLRAKGVASAGRSPAKPITTVSGAISEPNVNPMLAKPNRLASSPQTREKVWVQARVTSASATGSVVSGPGVGASRPMTQPIARITPPRARATNPARQPLTPNDGRYPRATIARAGTRGLIAG